MARAFFDFAWNHNILEFLKRFKTPVAHPVLRFFQVISGKHMFKLLVAIPAPSVFASVHAASDFSIL